MADQSERWLPPNGVLLAYVVVALGAGAVVLARRDV
jgi:hypothetical protein